MHSALKDTALIAVGGPDAASFLQAQLTSDVLALAPLRTQYSGYCSPKGRLLATFLLWRLENEVLLQLPAALATELRARLQKYVLRSRVTLSDAADRFRIHGFAGEDAEAAVLSLAGHVPSTAHEVFSRNGLTIARLGSNRYVVLAAADGERQFEDSSTLHALAPADAWSRNEIEAGIPWITAATQDQFVPQMVNLDLIGGVSYGKGCYPGQEIVARMHYLGRLKQRMYRIRFASAETAHAGDALFSPRFGAEQSCGTVLAVVRSPGDEYDGLAVVQVDSARDRAVHWKELAGPMLEFLPLPYAVPE